MIDVYLVEINEYLFYGIRTYGPMKVGHRRFRKKWRRGLVKLEYVEVEQGKYMYYSWVQNYRLS